jgi:16S rRNA (adenine1518-N6/adenine1519-N6)-dimethyltransferase
LFTVEQLAALGIDARLRAENLPITDYIKLANFLTDNPVEL